MTVTTAKILTVETVPSYIKDNWGCGIGKAVVGQGDNINAESLLHDADAAIQGIDVSAIQGGNVNYAFRIKLPAINNKVVFLKQVKYMGVKLNVRESNYQTSRYVLFSFYLSFLTFTFCSFDR
jgi:hypothetical protein